MKEIFGEWFIITTMKEGLQSGLLNIASVIKI